MSPTPKRALALRETTLAAINKLADEHTRSASDVTEAAMRLAVAYPETLRHTLAGVEQLQPTRGTGRRARREAQKENQKS